MGVKPIPDYANIFMASINTKIKNLFGEDILILLKRFLDDFFLIFQGSTKELHKLFEQINQIHPTIKFTMNHTSIEGEDMEDKCD